MQGLFPQLEYKHQEGKTFYFFHQFQVLKISDPLVNMIGLVNLVMYNFMKHETLPNVIICSEHRENCNGFLKIKITSIVL